MNSMTIRQKILFVFIMLILAFIGNGIYSAYSLSSTNDGALRIATEHLQGVIAASESGHAMSDYRQGEFAVIDATTLPARIHAAQQTKKLADQIDITFDNIQPHLTGKVAEDFSDMLNVWAQYKENSMKIIDLAKKGDTASAQRLIETSSDDYDYIGIKLNKILDNRKDFIHAETVQSTARFEQTRIILIVSIVVVVLFSIFMAMALCSSILNPIKHLTEVSKQLAAGNLTTMSSGVYRKYTPRRLRR